MTQPDTSRPVPSPPPRPDGTDPTPESDGAGEPDAVGALEPASPSPAGGVTIARVRGALGGQLGDGLAMSMAAGGASLVGMISWIVAARALTPMELGTATAFVSALLLIAGCTELNLGVGLLRWLPRAGGATTALLRRSGATVAVFAAVGASVYLLLPGTSVIVDASAGATGDRATGAAVFVLAAVLYALFQQQDFVLVGLGRAWWAPARTLLFAAGRLSILVVAGASLTTGGVVASWVVPTGACVLLVLLQSWLVTRGRPANPRTMPARREVVGFLGPTYLGRVATSVLFNQIPLLITFRFGPETGAAFFLVWQAVTVIDVVAQYFVSSLAAAVAREPERAAELSAQTRTRLLAVLGPGLLLGLLLAGPALSLFGEVYTAETPALRLMLVGLAFRLLVVHRLGEHQAVGRGVRYARLAMVNTGLMVAATAIVPATGNPLTIIAATFVVVQACCAATVTFRRSRERGRLAVVVRAGPGDPTGNPT